MYIRNKKQFVKDKSTGKWVPTGKVYHYLVEGYRDKKGKAQQRILAYLGEFDNVFDAWMNASGKRRGKLARYLDPADICNDAIERLAEREYKRRQQQNAPRRDIKRLLPHLPNRMLPDA
jgi:hypothetical protein